jgi:putative membrane protein
MVTEAMATEVLTENLDPKTQVVQKPSNWTVLSTRLASERTLMAALRTSLSLIGFGFTIYKFFESMRTTLGEGSPIRVHGPRRLGLTLVALGVLVLVGGACQHWLFLKRLTSESSQEFPVSISLIAAVLLALTGVVVFVTILVRI